MTDGKYLTSHPTAGAIRLGDELLEFSYYIPISSETQFGLRLLVNCDGGEEMAVDNIRIYGVKEINQPPSVSVNAGLTVDNGDIASLATRLAATDAEDEDATLTFTVTDSPNNGSLSLTTFTQAQLDAGAVTYTHDGTDTLSDGFTFEVVDSDGAELIEQTFAITVNETPPVPTPTPTATPTATPTPERLTNITGTLTDQNGNPLSGYTVELHSDPVTVVTDEAGKYTFNDVAITDHTLIVKNTVGTTLKTFVVSIEVGDDFSWNQPGGDSVQITLQDDTASIDVNINIAQDGDVTIDKIENIVNPKTGDFGTHHTNWVWTAVILSVLIVIAGLAMLKRSRKTA